MKNDNNLVDFIIYDSRGRAIMSEPLFKSSEEYENFRRSFSALMKQVLDEQMRRRAESAKEVMYQLVD